MVQQAAVLLIEDHWPDAWPDMEAALEEVRESSSEGRASRVALDRSGTYEEPARPPLQVHRELGFSIIGVMPDANGPGKPDIYMAKR
jgi:hypothetical protein